MRGRTSRGGGTDSHSDRGPSRFRLSPVSVIHAVAHILNPPRPERKPASITYFAEHQARENTRPHGNVERSL